jgi:cytochrome P450
MAVGSQAVRKYRTFQAHESAILVRDFLLEPQDFELSIERYSVSVTSIVGWGRRVDRKNDYVAQQALKLMEAVNFVVPGIFLMEAVPFLMHSPAWLYALPSQMRLGASVLSRYFYLLTQEGAEAKEHNFGKQVMASQQGSDITDVEVASLMGNLIGGGVDTTSSTMMSCILAMARFPEVQKKVHAEFDAVIGTDRSPSWEDIDSNALPYMTAVV